MNTNIPFLDLVTPHLELQEELTAVFQKVLRTAGFIGGPMVEEFEKSFAEFCGTSYAIGVSNGTDALRFALMACGVQPGEVVLTVPNTFIATTEAISQAGAVPEFVDIEERTYNLDPAKLRDYLERQCDLNASGKLISKRSGRRVTAVIPVHLYGQTADMDPILELAQRFELMVIEDACQAHGAQYFSRKYDRWLKAGSMGRAAAFSFYPGKNLGACGEAGAVTTNDKDIAKKIDMLRDHGQAKKYYHDIEGCNGRLDALQAGLLSVKLKHLAEWNEKRRDAALRYQELFQESGSEIVLPFEPRNCKAVHHLYVVQVADRDRVRTEIGQHNIGTGIHYPIPLHLQKAYAHMGLGPGSFPVAERAAERILSLPMFPNLSTTAQKQVVEEVNRAVRTGLSAATV
jgi:dTDP-4-amino-4,6-dideoxygalactose transaminase